MFTAMNTVLGYVSPPSVVSTARHADTVLLSEDQTRQRASRIIEVKSLIRIPIGEYLSHILFASMRRCC